MIPEGKEKKILIVDDMEINRDMLTVILEDRYPTLQAEGGIQAVEILKEHHDEIAAVLLDLIMEDMDGYAVLETMKKEAWLDKIPVIVISAESNVDVKRQCYEMSVFDFIQKPFDNAVVKNRIQNAVSLYSYKNDLEEKVEQQTETLKRQNKQLERQTEKLTESNVRIINILGTVVEFRNLESGEHVKRVRGFTKILAEQLMQDYPEYDLTPEKIEVIESASVLHDIGKIAISDGILLKPGKLTKEEYEEMKLHTTKGCEILNNIEDIWDEEEYGRACYEICRHHHERYDGKGYPDGLKGDEIPISAQLVSIADVYDALVSDRVYKSAYSGEEAYRMIMAGECGVFSPKLLDCFTKSRQRCEALSARYKNK